jgi:hypothetical protein
MRRICIILCFIYSAASGQDTIVNSNKHKCQISLLACGHYKTFLGKRYIEPTEDHPYNILSHQYEAFNKIPTYGFRLGILLKVPVMKNGSIISGLTYLYNREKFECGIDSFFKYHHAECEMHSLDVIKYDYLYHNLEIPLMVRYNIRNICLSGGVWFEMLSLYKATYTFFPRNSEDTYYSKNGVSAVKSFNYGKKPLQFVPFINVSYSMKIRNIEISPYIGIDFGKKKSIFSNLGVTVPLIGFQKK